MRLLSILPIARGVRIEILTYFSAEDIKVGTLVSIPLRKKIVPGIILESEDALAHKSAIKDMDFGIKKIHQHKDDVSLGTTFVTAAKKISLIAGTSIGAAIAALLPKTCLENPEIFFKKREEIIPTKKHFEFLAIQSSEEERFDTYKSIIREAFAKKKSIAVILPTEESVSHIKEILSKGIEDYVAILGDTTSKKQLKNFFDKIHTTDHPLLIIGTYHILSLLPETVGTIILEEESSRFYKSQRLPFIDMRIATREVAKELGIRYIIGDKLLSVESLHELKQGNITEYSRIAKRNPYKIQTLVVDMKPKTVEYIRTDSGEVRTTTGEKPVEKSKKIFEVLSSDLKEMILYSVRSNKKIFIYSVRRGIAPQTVCRDCGTTVLCSECESPVVLHTKGEEKKFVCHHCSKSRSALESCKHCGSWNLLPLGIGIERIEEEIKAITENPILRIDSDTSKTTKEARLKIEKFFEREDGPEKILLGTDLALRFIPPASLNFTAIISLDSLFSLPDFRTTERIMHTILEVKSKASECMLLQARNTEEKVIEYALAGDLESFVKDEIKSRKEFNYPPFVTIVKLTVLGLREKVKEDAGIVASRLKEYNPVIFPAFIKSIRGKTSLHIMIKIPAHEWPDKKLTDILLSLPPSVKIDTSPTSLL